MAVEFMKPVAKKFRNYTFHLVGAVLAGVVGGKARSVGKDQPTSDNWLLSELQRGGIFADYGEGVACFYREIPGPAQVNAAGNHSNF